MNLLRTRLLIALLGVALSGAAHAGVVLDFERFGQSLGGWDGRKKKLADYEMSDNRYRTYRPEITRTPDGGLYISVRIDHVRGLFASDDHASLEITVDKNGKLTTTRSSISIQGKRITSDLIAGGVRGASQASSTVAPSPAESVVSLGADLVANLTEKLSNESKVEPGRVTFPTVLQHNLNLIFQALRMDKDKVPAPPPALRRQQPQTPPAETASNHP